MTKDERLAQIRAWERSGKATALFDIYADIRFLLAELDAATKQEHDCMMQRNEAFADAEAEAQAAETMQKDIWALKAERDTLKAREATLRNALEQLVHAVDAHQAQAWATSDIDTSVARAALAAKEDTRG